MDYHRPRRLNGRVRDGNGCGPAGSVTRTMKRFNRDEQNEINERFDEMIVFRYKFP